MITKIIISILVLVIILSLLFKYNINNKEFLLNEDDYSPNLSTISVYDKDCSDCCNLEENKNHENCFKNCLTNGNICFCCKK